MRRDTARLNDILGAAEAAIRAAGPHSRLHTDDEVLVSALTYQLIVIGEAARAISADTRAEWPQLPWAEMIGMRTLIVHSYWRVDEDRLWRTVETDLPPLPGQLRRILSQAGSN